MADVLVAVDVGTSGARASAFEVSGAPGPEGRRSYPTFLPAEGWAEQDARRYRDNRATAEADLMRERFGDRKLHELTGHVPAAFHRSTAAAAS